MIPTHPTSARRKHLHLTPTQRLKRIAAIIENVDQRAMAADGNVTPTLLEMTQREMSEIYELARGA